jgi:hypothetical protein
MVLGMSPACRMLPLHLGLERSFSPAHNQPHSGHLSAEDRSEARSNGGNSNSERQRQMRDSSLRSE